MARSSPLPTQRRQDAEALQIIGAVTTASVTTGATSGTAGAGTSATSLAKPTAAANWTSSNLVGKWLKVTGGGGYDATRPTLRPILSNTTTAAVVNEVVGMDSTTTFELVDLQPMAAGFDGMQFTDVDQAMEIYGIEFGTDITDSLIELVDCRRVLISGCAFAANTASPSVSAEAVQRLTIEHCRLTAGADISIDKCPHVTLTGLVCSEAGTVTVANAHHVRVEKMTSTDAASNALRIERCFAAEVELTADDGGATALYAEDVGVFEAIGTLITGSGNTGYGMEIANSGRYYLVGCDIAGGTGDLYFQGKGYTWATLSNPAYGGVEGVAGSAVVNPSGTKMLAKGNRLFEDSIDVSGRALFYGYINQSAPLAAITLTGTDTFDLEAGDPTYGAGRGMAEIICNSASAKAVLPSGAAIAGVVVGIVNRGSNTLTVEPPAGGTINGGASSTIAAGASKTFVSLNGAGGKDWWVLT